jgi:hypothetical protein
MSSKKKIPNGPPLAGSAKFTDLVVGPDCTEQIVMRIYGQLWSCSDIFAKSFVTVPGGAVLSGTFLTGLSLPVNPTDAVNREYVDSLAMGFDIKDPVLAATTGNILLSGLQTIDGYPVMSGDRILVKDQTNGIENGIYVASLGVWARTTDLSSGDHAARAAINILNGTQNGSSLFVCTNVYPTDVVNTDALTFSLFMSGTVPGIGLSRFGNTLNVNLDNIGLEVNGLNIIQLKEHGIPNIKLINDSIGILTNLGSGLSGGSIVSLGSSVNLSVDSTVVRTTGAQTISGPKTFSDSIIFGSGLFGITVQAPFLTSSYTLILPVDDGASGQVLQTNGFGNTSWTTLNFGDVYGPSSSTDNSITRYDGITGKLIQNSTVILADNGDITGAGNITANSYTDGTATLSGGTLSGLLAPTLNNDAVNKKYVDDLIAGIKWKQPARLASTTDLPLSGLGTIDGVSVNSGDRILVKDQINPIQNGIYIASAGAWVRTNDLSNGSSAASCVVWIEEGLSQAETGYICTNDIGSDIANINPLSWLQFTGAGMIIAGDGLSKVLNTLNVNVDNSTIEIVLDTLQVKSLGITGAQIANTTIANNKLINNSTTIVTSDGISGGTTVALGSTVNLTVDSTVVRTSGNQTISGIKTFSNIETTVLSINSEPISGQRLYYGYDSTGLVSVTNTLQTLIFDQNVINDTGYTNLLGEITITSSGVYEVTYHVQFESSDKSGGPVATVSSFIELDIGSGFQAVNGSGTSCYFNEQNGNIASFGSGKNIFINAVINSVLRIRYSRIIGTSTCKTKPNESSLTIKRLRP